MIATITNYVDKWCPVPPDHIMYEYIDLIKFYNRETIIKLEKVGEIFFDLYVGADAIVYEEFNVSVEHIQVYNRFYDEHKRRISRPFIITNPNVKDDVKLFLEECETLYGAG
jgi:hypothetical protein